MVRDCPDGYIQVSAHFVEFPTCPSCECVVAGSDKVDWRTTEIMGGICIEFEIKCPNCGGWIDVHDGLDIDGGHA